MEGPRGPENLKILLEMQQALRSLAIPWVALADWNCTPDELAAANWDFHLDADILRPHTCDSTCVSGQGRLLDYALVSKSARGLVDSLQVVNEVPWSPHAGLRLRLCKHPRSICIRCLKTPAAPGFDAALEEIKS